mmetsp:Transcript_11166/g.26070  ORF Transcript_11166/g.26070 Transcript_11166/m.26070 type:complete len:311 (-) Transcript_11166:35-967(-)
MSRRREPLGREAGPPERVRPGVLRRRRCRLPLPLEDALGEGILPPSRARVGRVRRDLHGEDGPPDRDAADGPAGPSRGRRRREPGEAEAREQPPPAPAQRPAVDAVVVVPPERRPVERVLHRDLLHADDRVQPTAVPEERVAGVVEAPPGAGLADAHLAPPLPGPREVQLVESVVVEERRRLEVVVVPVLEVEHGRVDRGVHPLAHEVVDRRARLPVPPVRVIRPEDDQERDARDQDADAVGVAEVVRHGVRTARLVPVVDDGEVDRRGDEADDRPAVQGRAVDPAEEVEAVYALEVVDHGSRERPLWRR